MYVHVLRLTSSIPSGAGKYRQFVKVNTASRFVRGVRKVGDWLLHMITQVFHTCDCM